MTEDIIIEIDSREKQSWNFDIETKVKSGYKTRVIGSEIVGIEAGDYRIKSYPELVVIERKRGFSELFGNFTPKSNRERFEREMERLSNIKYKYILIESEINTDILSMSIPQFKWAPPCSKILEWLWYLYEKYNIQHEFIGNAGAKYVRKLFEHHIKNIDNIKNG